MSTVYTTKKIGTRIEVNLGQRWGRKGDEVLSIPLRDLDTRSVDVDIVTHEEAMRRAAGSKGYLRNSIVSGGQVPGVKNMYAWVLVPQARVEAIPVVPEGAEWLTVVRDYFLSGQWDEAIELVMRQKGKDCDSFEFDGDGSRRTQRIFDLAGQIHWQSLKNDIDNAIKEVPEDLDEDDIREWFTERANELGDQAVTYTRDAWVICLASRNDDYATEELGMGSPTIEQRAAAAYTQDLMEAFERREGEFQADEDDEGGDEEDEDE